MSNFVYNSLIAKGIQVTEKESIQLQTEWDQLQTLQADFDDVYKNEDDILLCQTLKGEF